jgi:hypothetical protein
MAASTQFKSPEVVQLPAAPLVEFLNVRGFESAVDRGNKVYTVYRLGVRCAGANPPEWEVFRRYRHFASLSKELKSIRCRVPPMPAKNPLAVQVITVLCSELIRYSHSIHEFHKLFISTFFSG